MARNLLLTLAFLLTATFVFAQTAVSGKVTDPESGEELIGANITFKKNGDFISGVATDFDGNYKINIDPGTYDVITSYIGLPDKQINGVIVKASQTTFLNIEMSSGEGGIDLDVVIVTDYKVPLIDKDNTSSGGVITSKQIAKLPSRNISALASNTAGLSQADEGDAISIRGSRTNDTNYYLDGIRISSSQLIPSSEIEQLQVITGGIAAQYGDVTGGIISITSKGPSKKYSGGLEMESSQYLDPFGYNLISANFSGPLIRKKVGEKDYNSILGFRISGQYLSQKDDDPPATAIFRVKDDVLAELEANPVLNIGGSAIPAAESLTNDDIDVLDYRPFESQDRLDLTAKLDARLSKNIDVTLSGTFADTRNQFTPGNGARDTWRVFNAHNNPFSDNRRIRGNFRFRHRLGSAGAAAVDGADAKPSIIQNAQYTIQVGYQKELVKLEDQRHTDNFFNYGYVGNFDYQWVPFFGRSEWTESFGFELDEINGTGAGFGHVDFQRQFRGYTPNSEINPVLANYNNNRDVSSEDQLIALNGFFVGEVTDIWQGFHTNVGQVFNLYREQDNDLYTFTANSSFDLVPGGSDKGRHSIQFGILYEQRFDRRYDINPRTLWTVARQLANRHILGVDTASVVGTSPRDLSRFGGGIGIEEIALHDLLINPSAEDQFLREIRELTGQSLTDYVNVDGLDPSILSLDLFSARELNDPDLLLYYGYDYLGNKLSDDVTFDDFFTTQDEEGRRTFPVASFKPNYFAAYVQDKFTFNEITFRVGLRVDRYDANTKVLKDPFSLNSIIGAKDFYDQNPEQTRPNNVGDDFKVYVDADGSTVVQAFRDGEQWFFANGSKANGGNLIFPSGLVFPAFIDPESDIKDVDYNPSTDFEDYEPQINLMPRLAFSFPISDKALFFAHYDVLVQRPLTGNIATALDYFYFQERTPLNNPNLRPSKTVDYEVGFRQAVSNTSAIKIAVYYKELRDMIQARTFAFVAGVNQYDSFGNLDFGTVKGFSFQYDLRRTGNVSANINYTLQFADGTGSDANSARGLTSRGNIRTLSPLSFDERHRIVASIDYRYASGRNYNGPRWFGKNVFANAGINFQTIAVSGRPFTSRQTPVTFGGAGFEGAINGARQPWNFTINARIDKSFSLSPSEKLPLDVNVYLRVSNLLNTQNVVNVYSASGSAEDDGFLLSTFGADAKNAVVQQGRDLDAYLSAYQWAVTNPDFFTLPRRIYLGAIVNF